LTWDVAEILTAGQRSLVTVGNWPNGGAEIIKINVTLLTFKF